MAPPSLACSFRALATLLSQAPDNQADASSRAVACFGEAELEALRSFDAAGRRCVTSLGSEALVALSELAAQGRPDGGAAKGKISEPPPKAEQRGVQLLLEKFGADGHDLIARPDFRGVLLELGLGQHFTAEELDALVEAGAAGCAEDGRVSVAAFSAWLCADELPAGGSAVPVAEGAAASEQVVPGARAEQTGSGADETDEESELLRVERSLRKQLLNARASLESSEELLKSLRKTSAAELKEMEDNCERAADGTTKFWRTVAQSSAGAKLSESMDMDTISLLGCGRYGFVAKFQRPEGEGVRVVKLMGVRWAHVAAQEWLQAQAVGAHANIVEYGDVLLHADNDGKILATLKAAQEDGRIPSKRAQFPDKFICLTEEFMNRGTVQDWMSDDRLLPGGCFCVMRAVASALAHMHAAGVTHNDVKPENVLLSQQNEADPRGEVAIKLADLGLAERSLQRGPDFQQYGMTVFCIVTGERFGARKIQAVNDSLCSEIASLLAGGASDAGIFKAAGPGGIPENGGVLTALARLPGTLRKVFREQITMAGVRDSAPLQGWSFFDGAAEEQDAA